MQAASFKKKQQPKLLLWINMHCCLSRAPSKQRHHCGAVEPDNSGRGCSEQDIMFVNQTTTLRVTQYDTSGSDRLNREETGCRQWISKEVNRIRLENITCTVEILMITTRPRASQIEQMLILMLVSQSKYNFLYMVHVLQ